MSLFVDGEALSVSAGVRAESLSPAHHRDLDDMGFFQTLQFTSESVQSELIALNGVSS